jgi:hypothetical protein
MLGKRDITCNILSYKPLEQNFEDEITKPSSSRTTTNSFPQETRKSLNISSSSCSSFVSL